VGSSTKGNSDPGALEMIAIVKNMRNCNVYLNFKDAQWSAAWASFDESGHPVLKDQIEADLDFCEHIIRAGGLVRLATVLGLSRPGICRLECCRDPQDVILHS
jgi:hypothetical protein